ncbi:MAG: ABC transporter ATP-binding protein [Candidatus Lokiarchaeota archaeon]|nr:ABC transporter ATP-binding protein [Candidatus Lokiarchaeota archaeon]
MSGTTPRVLETVLFSGDEFKQAIEWAMDREDELLTINVHGSETFNIEDVMKNLPKALIRAGFGLSKQLIKRSKDAKGLIPKDISKFEVFKEVELQGHMIKASRGFRKNFIAVSVVQGTIGDVSIPEGTILTIGNQNASAEDIRAYAIQLENQFKKNYDSRRFFDGREIRDACEYLNKVLESTQVSAQIFGIWSKTKQTFFGSGKVLRVIQHAFPKHEYFILLIDQGMVGQGNDLEKGRIIRVGGLGYINTEQVIAKKIILDPKLGVEIKKYDKVLEVENLTVDYGIKGKPIIENVNFSINDGEILGIVGESGAGKTTTLKAIIGDIKDYEGKIKVCGENARKKQVITPLYGYVPQDLSKMYLTYTPLRNIIHFGSQYGIPEQELIRRGKEILKDLGIFSKANQPVDRLSGGEKRRVSIAIALVHNPKILFLDEPTSGLDPTSRHELWSHLDKISRQYGVSQVVITHYPEEGEYCDKVAVFMKGKGFLEFGSPSELKQRLPGGGYAAELTLEQFDPDALELLKKIDDIDLILQRGGSIRIFAKDLNQQLYDKIFKTLNAGGYQVHRIEPKAEIDMIDYFLYKVKQYLNE